MEQPISPPPITTACAWVFMGFFLFEVNYSKGLSLIID